MTPQLTLSLLINKNTNRLVMRHSPLQQAGENCKKKKKWVAARVKRSHGNAAANPHSTAMKAIKNHCWSKGMKEREMLSPCCKRERYRYKRKINQKIEGNI